MATNVPWNCGKVCISPACVHRTGVNTAVASRLRLEADYLAAVIDAMAAPMASVLPCYWATMSAPLVATTRMPFATAYRPPAQAR